MKKSEFKKSIKEEIISTLTTPLSEKKVYKSAEYEEIDSAIYTIRQEAGIFPEEKAVEINKALDIIQGINDSESTMEVDEASKEEVENQKEFNKELEKTVDLSKKAGIIGEESDDNSWYEGDKEETDTDKEPSNKEISKGDYVTQIANKLGEVTGEMKSLVNKWKKEEGPQKDKVLARLKELTKIKKELEKLV